MKALSFEGNGLEYFKIWIVNILLTIVTIGLYYPWAKVRNHRYFYANATLEDRNFEYHATGKQLFIGYLIAMALFITYAIIQNISPVGSGIVFLIFIAALPWIIWRSLKFNMRVTSFSNVRFSFDGNLAAAYFNYLLLPILLFLSVYVGPLLAAFLFESVGGMIAAILVTVSLIFAIYMFALMKKKNTSYVVNNTQYGNGQFSTNLQAGEFLKILLKAVGLFLLAGIAYMILVGIIAMVTGIGEGLLTLFGNMENLQDPEAMSESLQGSVVGLMAIVYIGFIVISILVFSYSYSRQRAYVFANSKLDDKIELASTLKARPLAWISISNFFVIIFTLGLAIPWAKVRLTRFVLENTQVDTSVGFDSYVTQQEAEQSSLGEQIGDAFDVDVGIGI